MILGRVEVIWAVAGRPCIVFYVLRHCSGSILFGSFLVDKHPDTTHDIDDTPCDSVNPSFGYSDSIFLALGIERFDSLGQPWDLPASECDAQSSGILRFNPL